MRLGLGLAGLASVGIGGGGGAASYLGQVATRSYIPMTTNPALTSSMVRSRHFARDSIAQLRIALPNWYVSGTTFAETGVGASASVTAAIEYPVGVFTQVLFSGVATGVIPDLTTLFSDPVDVSIPKDAAFFVRFWRSCAGGIVFTGSIAQDGAQGDIFKYNSVVDLTMGGAFTSTDGSNMAFPCAIIAYTKKASAFLLGNSRIAGLNDTFSDASGDKGELARAIGPTMAYINAGVPSDQAQKFVASNARRRELAAFCSAVPVEYGINDLAGGRSDGNIRTDLLTIGGYFPGKKLPLCTMPPSTTGAWTLADGSDQTVKSFEASRVSNNDWRRTVPAPFTACYEIADVVEISRNNGKWKAPNYTGDGVHESNNACIVIRDSGAVSLAQMAR